MEMQIPNTSMKRVGVNLDVNHNELYMPINFKKLFDEHGVRKGTICHSATWQSWVIVGHPDIDMILIDAPYKAGDIYTTESKGRQSRFNGMTVSSVCIKMNLWVFIFDEYWQGKRNTSNKNF